jgi:hypothetical protein
MQKEVKSVCTQPRANALRWKPDMRGKRCRRNCSGSQKTAQTPQLRVIGSTGRRRIRCLLHHQVLRLLRHPHARRYTYRLIHSALLKELVVAGVTPVRADSVGTLLGLQGFDCVLPLHARR